MAQTDAIWMTSRKLTTLKARSDFQRVRGGGRATSAAFVLEGKRRPAVAGKTASDRDRSTAALTASGPRFGFTITKKTGKAHVRNRIRRRLKAALLKIACDCADPGTDYVVVARTAAAALEFTSLVADLRRALETVQKALAKPKSARLARPSPGA